MQSSQGHVKKGELHCFQPPSVIWAEVATSPIACHKRKGPHPWHQGCHAEFSGQGYSDFEIYTSVHSNTYTTFQLKC